MPMIRRTLLLLTVLLVALATPARAGDEPIVATDLLRLRTVDAVDVSWSGDHAVVTVRSIETVDEPAPDPARARKGDHAADHAAANPTYEYRSHLLLFDLNDAERPPLALTSGTRTAHGARFAPKGRQVAFLRAGERTHDAPQVWLLSLDGGEATQITDVERGIDSIEWSPDGTRLLLGATVPMDELDGTPPWPSGRPNRAWNDAPFDDAHLTPRPDGTREEIRAWLDRNAADGDPIVITRLDFQGEFDLRDEYAFRHLFILDLDDPTRTPRRITSGFHDHGGGTFMPDGRTILFAARPPTNTHVDEVLGRDLWRVSVDGTDERPLIVLEGWDLRDPQPSADGAQLAFIARQSDDRLYRQDRLGVLALRDVGAGRLDPLWLTDDDTFPPAVDTSRWLPGRGELIFTCGIAGARPIMVAGPGLATPTPLVERDGDLPVGVESFGAGGGRIVYAATTVDHPCVLRVLDATGDRTLLDLNPWTNTRRIVRPKPGTLTRPDGTRVDYWIMPPAVRESGKTHPLVLEIHGGPAAMWGPGELSMWHEFQLLCARGYGIVYANPRGSGGYGYDFERANFQDWGAGPGGDVLAAVDAAVAEDWVDRRRLVVTGGSYGGYLTAWVIANDFRFKAAVAQRGVYDLSTFFGEGNAWRLVEWSMGGNPYESRVRDILARNSPFNQVQRIRTPLLIMHSSRDLRTGVSQSEMLYRALRAMGRAVEYVRYPDAGHDLSRSGNPVQRLDRLNRIIEFFDRYVMN
ncbi:MAG: S9 family peptidase [Phycisphaerales bacterium]|nr:S9 family peptidase [Phycisphaerales bacterium]